jgi:hypothetical protein
MLAMKAFGYKSKIYSKAKKEPIHLSRVHCRVAVAAAMSSVAYKQIQQNNADGQDGVTLLDLRDAFKHGGFLEEDARKLAAHIMKVCDKDNDGLLNFLEWSNAVETSDLTDIQKTLKHLDTADTVSFGNALGGVGERMLAGGSGGQIVPMAPVSTNLADARAAPGMKTIEFVVPPGVPPGSQVTISADGEQVQVIVPMNATAGAKIKIQVPAW